MASQYWSQSTGSNSKSLKECTNGKPVLHSHCISISLLEIKGVTGDAGLGRLVHWLTLACFPHIDRTDLGGCSADKGHGAIEQLPCISIIRII